MLTKKKSISFQILQIIKVSKLKIDTLSWKISLKSCYCFFKEIEGESVQLLRIDKDGNFTINHKALQIIQGLKGNVAVCIIVGPQRTGMSLLMNSIINIKNEFKLVTNAVLSTQGFWMLDTPIIHRNEYGE
jgi:hypothetical protein